MANSVDCLHHENPPPAIKPLLIAGLTLFASSASFAVEPVIWSQGALLTGGTLRVEGGTYINGVLHVRPGAVLTLRVEGAQDTDHRVGRPNTNYAGLSDDPADTIRYTWIAGAGSLSNTSGISTSWTAPSSRLGTYTISCRVDDVPRIGFAGANDPSVTLKIRVKVARFQQPRVIITTPLEPSYIKYNGRKTPIYNRSLTAKRVHSILEWTGSNLFNRGVNWVASGQFNAEVSGTPTDNFRWQNGRNSSNLSIREEASGGSVTNLSVTAYPPSPLPPPSARMTVTWHYPYENRVRTSNNRSSWDFIADAYANGCIIYARNGQTIHLTLSQADSPFSVILDGAEAFAGAGGLGEYSAPAAALFSLIDSTNNGTQRGAVDQIFSNDTTVGTNAMWSEARYHTNRSLSGSEPPRKYHFSPTSIYRVRASAQEYERLRCHMYMADVTYIQGFRYKSDAYDQHGYAGIKNYEVRDPYLRDVEPFFERYR